jgi:putative spermidine/putrescine transport system substrate-binding protein
MAALVIALRLSLGCMLAGIPVAVGAQGSRAQSSDTRGSDAQGSDARGSDTQEPAARPHPGPSAHAVKNAVPRTPELLVASLGGALQDAQQATLFAPFSQQNGVHVRLEGWDGTLATLQKRAETGSDDWDLVLMDEAPLREACREGLFLSKPLAASPADTAPDSSGRDCGVGAWRMNLVLAWDKSRVDMTSTWADFWDVALRPGKRGLRRDPRGTLEVALMADGVAPEDVYRTLATPEGVDRAFRKLDQLKPYVVWWSTPADAVQIIESGAVLMTSAPNGEIAAANQTDHRSFGTQWAQSLGFAVGWAVPRATTPERRALAQRLLGFLVDPARQAAFLAAYPVVPTVQAAGGAPGNAGQKPDGHGADEHRRATLMVDDGFWADHLVSLRRRFDSWIDAK